MLALCLCFFDQVGVDLGGFQGGVAQKACDGFYGHALLEQVGGDGMAQGVGSDVFVFEGSGAFFEDDLDGKGQEVRGVGEKHIFSSFEVAAVGVDKVSYAAVYRRRERYVAVFIAFGLSDVQHFLIQMNVLEGVGRRLLFF